MIKNAWLKYVFILISAFFLTATNVCAEDAAPNSDIESFKYAYAEYKKLSEQGMWHEALPHAETTFKIGRKLLGDDNKKTAVLAFHYGTNLAAVRYYEKAREIFTLTLELTEKQSGKNSEDLIPILVELGRIARRYNDSTEENKPLERAVNIASETFGKNSIRTAELMSVLGNDYYLIGNSPRAHELLTESHELLEKKAGSNDIRTGLAAFYLGQYYHDKNRLEAARGYYVKALEAFDNPDQPDQVLELQTRGQLVNVYELLGDQKSATEHCLAIGKMTPAHDIQNYLPVFKKAPDYPNNALKKGQEGYTVVEFSVSEFGFVENPKIIESSDPVFDQASLEATKKFRYAPKFVDGKPVRVDNVRNKLSYKLE